MRGFIFTERERERLREWLCCGVEDQGTRALFVAVRRNVPVLRGDLELLLRVVVELRRRGRWRGRVVGGVFGCACRRVECALIRLRGGGST